MSETRRNKVIAARNGENEMGEIDCTDTGNMESESALGLRQVDAINTAFIGDVKNQKTQTQSPKEEMLGPAFNILEETTATSSCCSASEEVSTSKKTSPEQTNFDLTETLLSSTSQNIALLDNSCSTIPQDVKDFIEDEIRHLSFVTDAERRPKENPYSHVDHSSFTSYKQFQIPNDKVADHEIVIQETNQINDRLRDQPTATIPEHLVSLAETFTHLPELCTITEDMSEFETLKAAWELEQQQLDDMKTPPNDGGTLPIAAECDTTSESEIATLKITEAESKQGIGVIDRTAHPERKSLKFTEPPMEQQANLTENRTRLNSEVKAQFENNVAQGFRDKEPCSFSNIQQHLNGPIWTESLMPVLEGSWISIIDESAYKSAATFTCDETKPAEKAQFPPTTENQNANEKLTGSEAVTSSKLQSNDKKIGKFLMKKTSDSTCASGKLQPVRGTSTKSEPTTAPPLRNTAKFSRNPVNENRAVCAPAPRQIPKNRVPGSSLRASNANGASPKTLNETKLHQIITKVQPARLHENVNGAEKPAQKPITSTVLAHQSDRIQRELTKQATKIHTTSISSKTRPVNRVSPKAEKLAAANVVKELPALRAEIRKQEAKKEFSSDNASEVMVTTTDEQTSSLKTGDVRELGELSAATESSVNAAESYHIQNEMPAVDEVKGDQQSEAEAGEIKCGPRDEQAESEQVPQFARQQADRARALQFSDSKTLSALTGTRSEPPHDSASNIAIGENSESETVAEEPKNLRHNVPVAEPDTSQRFRSTNMSGLVENLETFSTASEVVDELSTLSNPSHSSYHEMCAGLPSGFPLNHAPEASPIKEIFDSLLLEDQCRPSMNAPYLTEKGVLGATTVTDEHREPEASNSASEPQEPLFSQPDQSESRTPEQSCISSAAIEIPDPKLESDTAFHLLTSNTDKLESPTTEVIPLESKPDDVSLPFARLADVREKKEEPPTEDLAVARKPISSITPALDILTGPPPLSHDSVPTQRSEAAPNEQSPKSIFSTDKAYLGSSSYETSVAGSQIGKENEKNEAVEDVSTHNHEAPLHYNSENAEKAKPVAVPSVCGKESRKGSTSELQARVSSKNGSEQHSNNEFMTDRTLETPSVTAEPICEVAENAKAPSQFSAENSSTKEEGGGQFRKQRSRRGRGNFKAPYGSWWPQKEDYDGQFSGGVTSEEVINESDVLGKVTIAEQRSLPENSSRTEHAEGNEKWPANQGTEQEIHAPSPHKRKRTRRSGKGHKQPSQNS